MIRELGANHDFSVEATEDATAFTPENLSQYEAVVWLSTTGDVLNDQQQAAFEQYVQAGGGYAGIHAASDTEYDWPWYGELVGAYFDSHPEIQEATVDVEDPAHPSTKHLPAEWTRTDEWYNYQSNPRANVHVLASLDESSYTGGNMGADHPIAWCHNYDGGRAWYTGAGHTEESYTEPAFRKHVLGGIRTAAGAQPSDCAATNWSKYDKVTLDDDTLNPMELDIAPDGRVFYIERFGEIWAWDPETSQRVEAGQLDVFTDFESGLLGIALDPNFEQNNRIYLFHSPVGENVDRLSRFTVNADSTIDLSSEQPILDVPVQRQTCCHHGGSLVFAPDGTLYISTGDNTNPFESDGFAPIDERSGRAAYDAQRSAANTNSLSGKILRIEPTADGYTVPDGNLFAPGTANTKPEIYAMGFRNPFRIGIDPKTSHLMVADYGPDAPTANVNRGPEGRVEWNLLKQPGNYGWPYCHSDVPYNDYDFANDQPGDKFDCSAPANDSPNNTGQTELPQAVAADVWYGRVAGNNPYPELGVGGAPMGGPVYRFDPDLQSDRKWPAYWDGKAMFGEWGQSKLYSFQLGEKSKLIDINQILTSMNFKRPMDIEFGPDGAMYLIEWGDEFGGDNQSSGVYRIDYVLGNRLPVAQATADQRSGPVPLEVAFSSAGSHDPDGEELTYAWDFDSDGAVDSTQPNPTHTYTEAGNYTAKLTVTDADDGTGVANVPIVAGNTAPMVTFDAPPDGGFFEFGDEVRFQLTVTDPEDGQVDCAEVTTATALGHDTHDHGFESYEGCEAVVQTHGDDSHGDDANTFYVLTASYTDHGGAGDSRPLTTRKVLVLQPKHQQAEYFDQTGRVPDGAGGGDPGVSTETTGDAEGGYQNVAFAEDGDWFAHNRMSLLSIDSIEFRAASATEGGTIEVHRNAPDGPLLGSVDMPNTGGWQTYDNFAVELTDPPVGTGPLYFVVRRPAGSSTTGALLNVNWMDFVGQGVTEPAS